MITVVFAAMICCGIVQLSLALASSAVRVIYLYFSMKVAPDTFRSGVMTSFDISLTYLIVIMSILTALSSSFHSAVSPTTSHKQHSRQVWRCEYGRWRLLIAILNPMIQ